MTDKPDPAAEKNAVHLKLLTVILTALFVFAELGIGALLVAFVDATDTFARQLGAGLVGSAITLIAGFAAAKPTTTQEPSK